MQHFKVVLAAAAVCVGLAACSTSNSGDGPVGGAGEGGRAGEPPVEAGAGAVAVGGSSQAGVANEPEAGAGGEGTALSSCAPPSLLGADDLTWQALPNLADDANSEPDLVCTSVDAQGRIYVAAALWDVAYALPIRIEAYRLNGDVWELLGGEPVAVGIEGQFATPLGVAAAADQAFVLYTEAGTEPRLMHSVGEGWSELALDADYAGFVPRLLRSDARGRPLLLALSDEQARVLVYGADGFEPVGEPFDVVPSGSALVGYGDVALACNGLAAVLVWPSVFTFDGQSWQLLGEVGPSANPAHTAHLAMGPDGKPLVAWRDIDDSDQDTIATVLLDPQTGRLEPLDGADAFQVGASYPVPAVDNANQAYLAWRSNGPYVAAAVNGAWQRFIEDGNANGGQTLNGTLPAFTLDLEGLPVVVWQGVSDDSVSIGVARAVPR